VDTLAVGIVITDEFGRVTLINHEAQRVLDQRAGLLVKDGRLTASAVDGAAVLETMTRAALATAAGEPTVAPTSARIRRRRGRDLLVTIVGISPRATRIARNRPGAAIFITDPSQQTAVTEQVLLHLYGLTRAEARLTNLIASGMPLQSAATVLSISRNTVRNRLQVVYEKTGTMRQSELAALMARLGSYNRTTKDMT
jgi:DNA-binding CsgD family transcriptional regulator